MTYVNGTHNPTLWSWVASANRPGSDFPIQNLPYGIFRPSQESGGIPRVGVAIGDCVLDVAGCIQQGFLHDLTSVASATLGRGNKRLNAFMALSPTDWSSARNALQRLLEVGQNRHVVDAVTPMLHPIDRVEMLMPVRIGDYTDFYASKHHARNVGAMFRPQNPLLPNYKHIPIAYHGRASSIVISGTDVQRPWGQVKTGTDDDPQPRYQPSYRLDYEMELGVLVGGSTALGAPVLPMDRVDRHLFGMVMVNDWSARDIQAWEYQPLGPFLGKSFATSISPWVVTMEALAPYRIPGPSHDTGDPNPLPHLRPTANWGFDITVEVFLSSQTMRERNRVPHRISRGSFGDMYWTVAQMLIHHTSNGCNLQTGDLLASGTISGPTDESRGSLVEQTRGGKDPIQLPDGTPRSFLQDGDQVIMRAFAQREGTARVGFGEVSGMILQAHDRSSF